MCYVYHGGSKYDSNFWNIVKNKTSFNKNLFKANILSIKSNIFKPLIQNAKNTQAFYRLPRIMRRSIRKDFFVNYNKSILQIKKIPN